MKHTWRSAGRALMGGVCLFALQAQAAEPPSDPAHLTAAEHCLKSLGLQDVQPFKEMAKEMSPEILMDRVFSAVAPEFQNALLSRPAEAGKPAKRPEALRDPRYFQPAIATVPLQNRWVNVTTDGRVLEPAVSSNNSVTDPNWSRMPGESKGEPQKKPSLPELFSPAVPRRY
jgi:hypothetical protein